MTRQAEEPKPTCRLLDSSVCVAKFLEQLWGRNAVQMHDSPILSFSKPLIMATSSSLRLLLVDTAIHWGEQVVHVLFLGID